jgi:hypothetical protein
MNFSDLVSISGLSGLYQLMGTKADGAIVKNFDDDKTLFVSARKHEVTPLDSIEVYTQTDNVPLREVFLSFKKNEGEVKEVAVHKQGNKVIEETFGKLFPDYDKSRVYASDMKKMLKWYGILSKLDLLESLEATKEGESVAKKAAATKGTQKHHAQKSSSKQSSSKKAATRSMNSKNG